MADLNANVEKQALQPISSGAGPQSATGRSISELIAAAQHGAQVAANQLGHNGIFNVQLLPAGAASTGSGMIFDQPSRT